jgi:hypothetical protein
VYLLNGDPGPEGPALAIPGGDFVCRHITLYGAQYWNDGVMEKPLFLNSSKAGRIKKFEIKTLAQTDITFDPFQGLTPDKVQ